MSCCCIHTTSRRGSDCASTRHPSWPTWSSDACSHGHPVSTSHGRRCCGPAGAARCRTGRTWPAVGQATPRHCRSGTGRSRREGRILPMATKITEFKPRQRHPTSARKLAQMPEPLQRRVEEAKALVAEPFKGLTADGQIIPGLYSIRKTGVSTQPIVDAAAAFLAALTLEQRAVASFDLEASEWRQWSNIHPFLMRHGQLIEELDGGQREAALAMLRTPLSASGFQTRATS